MNSMKCNKNVDGSERINEAATIPEVLEQIFKHLDVQNLKRCRFVSQVWNSEASRALQRKSHVYLHEEGSKLDAFRELLPSSSNAESSTTPRPCPFRRLFVAIESLHNRVLLQILSHEHTNVVELYLNQAPASDVESDEFQQQLHSILMKNANTLRYFRVALRSGVNLGITPPSNLQKPPPMHLPKLKDFGFWELSGGGSKMASVDFLIQIINGAPNLQQFCSSCADADLLDAILNQCNLQNLESFYAESVIGRHVELLCKMNMPRLKSLILQADVDSMPEEQKVPSETLQAMVAHFSATLEELNISWIASTDDETFPHCPKLKILNIDGWDGSLGIFDPFTLPSLKHICVADHQELDDSIWNPHDGVEGFSIETTTRISAGDSLLIEEFDYLLLYCRYQYPNLKNLDLTMGLNDEILRSVIRSLPNLESLVVDTSSRISSHVFTGRNALACRRFVEEGHDPREVAIMPSLRDLRSLKKLVVGRYTRSHYPDGFKITDHIVEYGIAEMPALKVFQLNWNPGLSVPHFVNFLGHLDRIIINNSCDADIQEPTRLLQSKLAQVELESNIL